MLLTGAVGRLALQRHDLLFLLVCLHRQVRQVLLHLSGHLSVFVQLLGVEKRAATHSFLVGATLHIQHVGVGAALAQRPDEEMREGGRGRKREEVGGWEGGRKEWGEVNRVKDGQWHVKGI